MNAATSADTTDKHKIDTNSDINAESHKMVADNSIDVTSSTASFPLPQALVQQFNGCHHAMADSNTLHESSPSLLSPLCSVPRTLASSRSSMDANLS